MGRHLGVSDVQSSLGPLAPNSSLRKQQKNFMRINFVMLYAMIIVKKLGKAIIF